MLGAANLFRVVQEFVFILLGALLVVLALSGRVPDRHGMGWPVLAAVIVFWGLRAWWRAGRPGQKWQAALAGASLILVGGLMLVIVWAPFDWVQPLLMAAGGVLALRGVAGAGMALRPS